MKKVFIDCGANDGCSVRKFFDLRKDAKEFFIYCFEPNEKLHEYFNDIRDVIGEKLALFPWAVSDKNQTLTLYTNPNYSCSGTTDPHKGKQPNCGSHFECDKVEEQLVRAIDLAEWISDELDIQDYIILKLDVEGAEYQIVPHFIRQNTFDFVNEMYIEWHPNWCNKPECLSIEYEKAVEASHNLKMNFWDAQDYKVEPLVDI